MSNKKDYATGTVAVAPSTPTAGTDLELETGEGARMPATPFFTTAHPPAEFPTLDNAEKLEVTDVTGDVLTIVRAQGDTSAQPIDVGWRISNAIFEADFDEKVDKTTTVNGQALSSNVTLDADDIDDSATTHKFATAAEKTKLGHIAVTQAVDLDAMETKLATIETNADVTDAANVGAAGAFMKSVDDTDDITEGTKKFTTAADITKLAGIEALADVTDAGNVGSSIHGASAKTTPVDADTMPLIDSAASNVLKKVTWANIKATIKDYYDSVTATLTNKTLTEPLITGSASTPSTPASSVGKIYGSGTSAVRPKWINSSAVLESLLTDKGIGKTAYTNSAKSPSAGGSGFYQQIGDLKVLVISGLSTNNSAWWFVEWSAVGFTSAPYVFGTASDAGSVPAGWVEVAGYTSGGGGLPTTTGCSILTRLDGGNSSNSGGVSLLVIGY
jgi:hypothetical protein